MQRCHPEPHSRRKDHRPGPRHTAAVAARSRLLGQPRLPYFPAGSVHLAIVDPGVGTERDILLAECDGHVFMAPDNGLLAQLLRSPDDAQVWQAGHVTLASLDLPTPSATFHGRDIFAPVAAELAAGRIAPSASATPRQDWTPGWLDEPDVPRARSRA